MSRMLRMVSMRSDRCIDQSRSSVTGAAICAERTAYVKAVVSFFV